MALSNADFVHLHLHSDFSLLDGACKIKPLMEHAASIGMQAVALTDHGNLFGAVEFYKQAKSHNLKPIIGCEIYLVWDHALNERPPRDRHKVYHMGLLAKNATGYHNLSKLVTVAHTQGMYYRPRADMNLLQQHAEGLIGFSGCMQGVIPQHLLQGDYAGATAACERFVGIFGREHFFIEIQDHGIAEQQRIIPGLLRLAQEFKLKVVATNDVHYLRPEHWEPHDSLLCIQTGAKLDDEKRMRYESRQFYLKDMAAMHKLFPDNADALTQTRLVAEMCDLELDFKTLHYPVYPLPESVVSKGQTRSDYLLELCSHGLWDRYGVKLHEPNHFSKGPGRGPDFGKELVERLHFELSVIEKTGFTDYFLIVWDFIDWAKRKGISVGPGRGSGAGCLVAYLIGITDIDPLRFGLLFERFLNPERVSPPDFDIDFCMRRRGEVIEYVRGKYGSDCVASIITFGTLGAKMVVRDLARVMNVPYAEGDRLAKMIPDELNITLESSLAKSEELRREVERNPLARRIIDQGKVIEGMVRNSSTHAAGIIIGDRPLAELVPLTLQESAQGKGSVLATQYPKEPVEELGLLKMDFLGLKTLTVLADAEANIRRIVDPKFSIESVPFDDPNTFSLLNSGRTVCVFQLESEGMQNLCRRFQISSIDEILALIALYRPGPMQFIDDYVRGKQDPATVSYAHPLLEEVCRETYGVMVYQEQVMEAARRIAGYSLAGADLLRRAMGKKKKEIMDQERARFIEGAREVNQIAKAKASEIFDILAKFAGYGFNKSHSAAYAYLAYRTAYLKANFPVEFMAAVLSAELGKADKVSAFIGECNAMRIPVLGPDINQSREMFTPVRDGPQGRPAIRFGLSAIKGVGEAAAQSILSERGENGAFTSFAEFAGRIDLRAVNRRVLECLIRTGGFDSLGEERSQLLAGLDAILQNVSSLQKDREAGQTSLFDLADAGREASSGFSPVLQLPDVPPMPKEEQLTLEFELLGFYLSGHPLDKLGPIAEVLNSHSLNTLNQASERTPFRLVGVMGKVEKRLSRRDNRPWAQFSIQQPQSSYSFNMFADVFQDFGSALIPGELALVFGVVNKRNDEVSFIAEEVHALEPIAGRMIQSITWILENSAEALDFLKLLQQELSTSPGETRIRLAFQTNGRAPAECLELDSFLGWKVDIPLFQEFRNHPSVRGLIVEPVPFTWQSSRKRWGASSAIPG